MRKNDKSGKQAHINRSRSFRATMKDTKKNGEIEIGDTIISRVLGEHNDDNNEYGKVIGFAGCYNEIVVVEDNNGYEFSLERFEIDGVVDLRKVLQKMPRGTFWF